MASPTPKLRIEEACRRFGRPEFVRRCEALFRGVTEDSDFIITLGGSAAFRLLNDGIPDHQKYWLRVWAMRGMLWAGPGDNAPLLRDALADSHWRVREMACKVAARHRMGDLLDGVAELEADPIKRVRTAAVRAAAAIVAAEA